MRIVGIDLGTTTSAVAFSEGGAARLLADPSGRYLIPTVVHVPPTGDPIVGIAARNRLNIAPDRTFAGIKRLLGVHIDSDEARSLSRLYGWQLERGANQQATFTVDDRPWRAVDLATEVYRSLRAIAQRHLNETKVRAVITVPAGFTHAQRRATLDAAERADIQVERLLNEPTAAAIAYGLESETGRKIAVFDLGGGTFDITILEVQSTGFEVLGTLGDTMLGSSDIDGAIAQHICDVLRTHHRTFVQPKYVPRLLPAAERMKIELSSAERSSADVTSKWIGAPGADVFHIEMDRAQVEALARPFVQRCLACVRACMEKANLEASDVDDVILVGGGSLMPLVQRAVESFFEKKPRQELDPEQVVVLGAARWAEELSQTTASNQTRTLADRSANGLGIGTIAGIVDYIIAPNSAVPAEGTRLFTTSSDWQTRVKATIYQGSSRRAEDCRPIGEIVLEDLPARRRGQTTVTVTFKLDAEGLVTVSAIDSDSGVSREVQFKGVLS